MTEKNSKKYFVEMYDECPSCGVVEDLPKWRDLIFLCYACTDELNRLVDAIKTRHNTYKQILDEFLRIKKVNRRLV